MGRIVSLGVLLAMFGTTSLGAWAEVGQAPTQETPAATAQRVAKVDLNAANKEALEALPGIGPRTAELIIEYRSQSSGFKKVEELMNVRGIGERTFLRLRELVQVSAQSERQ